MTHQGNVAKFYKRKQVESATPGQLIVLLYEGASEHLVHAEQCLKEPGGASFEAFHNHLIACQNILTELSVSLDMEQGGDIAKNLYRLYEYMNYRLVDANMSKDIQGVQEIRELIATLRDAWVDVVKQENGASQSPRSSVGLNLQG